MKKKITHTDGRVEELEGTPEEIAQVEAEIARRSGGSAGSPVQEDKGQGRRVLTDEIQRSLAGLTDEQLKSLKFWIEFVKIPAYKPVDVIPWAPQLQPLWPPDTIIWATPDLTTLLLDDQARALYLDSVKTNTDLD